MAVVGIGEIAVVPSMAGFQKEVGKEVAGLEGSKPVKKAGLGVGKALKVAAGVGLAGAATFLGTALTKGFGRLQAIENAKASLAGLGHSAQNIEKIMGDASAAVKGTAFGLGDAATVAASAVAAGIKPGKDLQRTLTLMGDAATIAKTDIGSMGSIINKVATSDMMQMDVANQLMDAGIPILQLVGKEMGVTADEARNLASKGKVSFEVFQAALESGLGGAAQESGKTLQGAFANSMAAIGRFGANLMSGVYPQITTFFSGFIGWMEPLEEKAKVVGEALGVFLGKAVAGIKGVTEILIQGNFSGALRDAFGIEEDHPLVDFLFNVREGFIGITEILFKGNFSGILREAFGIEEDHPFVNFLFNVRDTFLEVIGGVKAFTAAWVYNDGEVTSSGFPGFMERLGYAARQTFDFLLNTAIPALGSLAGWMFENEGAVKVVVGVIGALMLPMLIRWGVQATIAGVKNVAAFVMAKVEAIKSAAVFVAQSYRMIGGWIAMSASAVANGIKIAAVWTAQIVKSAVVGTVKFLVQVGRTVAGWALMGVQSLLHAAKMAAAWVVAMGPIGWAIAAIVGIAAIVIANWDKIKRWTIDTWNAVSGKIRDVWNNNIKPIFQAIGDFLNRTLGPAFRFFKDKVIDPVWNGIRTVIKGVWENGIKPIFTIIQQVLKGDLTGAFQTAKDAIDRIWKGVANVVRKPINFVIGTVYNNGIRSVFNKVAKLVGISELDPADEIKAYAKGGLAKKGWALVGEEGPELVNFSNPGRVYTAAETQAMLAGNQQAPMGALDALHAQGVDTRSHAGIGGWLSDPWGSLKSTVRSVGDAVKKGLDWVRGGLAKAAEWVLNPIKNGLASSLGTTGFGGMAGGLAKKAIDGAINWLRGKDEEFPAEGGDAALFFDGALGRFAKPANGHITSGFGASRGKWPHMGIDFAVPIGSAVRAMLNGIVRKVGWNAASGRTGKGMIVDHAQGYSSYYGHLNAWGKRPGQEVKAGERIADSGNTGRSTGPHLHAELWKNGKPFNYRNYLYDNGGVLPTGLSQIVNASGKPEAILSNSQWKAMSQLAERGTQAQYPASMQLVVDDYEFTAYVRGVADDSQRRNVAGLQRLQRNMTGTR